MKTIKQLTPDEAGTLILRALGVKENSTIKFVLEEYSSDYYERNRDFRLARVEVHTDE